MPDNLDTLLLKYPKARQSRYCSVYASDKADLIDELRVRKASAFQVREILRLEFGIEINVASLQRHFRRECKCPPMTA